MVAATLLSVGESSSKGVNNADPNQILVYGIIPVLVASVLSGLASSLCQWASQVRLRFSDTQFLLLSQCRIYFISSLGEEANNILHDCRDVSLWDPLLVGKHLQVPRWRCHQDSRVLSWVDCVDLGIPLYLFISVYLSVLFLYISVTCFSLCLSVCLCLSTSLSLYLLPYKIRVCLSLFYRVLTLEFFFLISSNLSLQNFKL